MVGGELGFCWASLFSFWKSGQASQLDPSENIRNCYCPYSLSHALDHTYGRSMSSRQS